MRGCGELRTSTVQPAEFVRRPHVLQRRCNVRCIQCSLNATCRSGLSRGGVKLADGIQSVPNITSVGYAGIWPAYCLLDFSSTTLPAGVYRTALPAASNTVEVPAPGEVLVIHPGSTRAVRVVETIRAGKVGRRLERCTS